MTNTPYKTTFESIAAIPPYLGQEIGLSDWFVIDQELINKFGALTKDEQWIHVDPDKSAQFSPYKQPIAHGFLVLSMCPHLAEQCFELHGTKMIVNYGFDKIRFTNAVTVGSKIRGRFTLKAFEQKQNSAKCTYGVWVEIEGQEKPALVAEWITLVFD